MSKLLNELYGEARNIVDKNGWGDEVRKEINWPVSVEDMPWVYCKALSRLIFFEIMENGQKITPEMGPWYGRARDYAIAIGDYYGETKQEPIPGERVSGLADWIKKEGIPGTLIRLGTVISFYRDQE